MQYPHCDDRCDDDREFRDRSVHDASFGDVGVGNICTDNRVCKRTRGVAHDGSDHAGDFRSVRLRPRLRMQEGHLSTALSTGQPKAAMKIDPTRTPTGNAPVSGSGIAFTLEGEWEIGQTADRQSPTVTVTTDDAGDATLDDLGETFRLTPKGVEVHTSERVTWPSGNELAVSETADDEYHTAGFGSIDNGTLAVAEVTSVSDTYDSVSKQVGPLLFTIMAK